MKRAFAFLVLAAPIAIAAQTTISYHPPAFKGGCSTSLGAPVTDLPYSATIVHKFSQTLGDGTNIHREQTTHVARDAQGRTMCESDLNPPFDERGFKSVVVGDPVSRTIANWTTHSKTATVHHYPNDFGAHAGPPSPPAVSTNTVTGRSNTASSTGTVIATIGSGAGSTQASHHTFTQDPNLKIEELGHKTIAGIDAGGRRTTTTIPVGKEGNDRDIVSSHEDWYSRELKINVLSISLDPRYGDESNEVIELNRAEPDPALFQVPEGYTIRETNPQPN